MRSGTRVRSIKRMGPRYKDGAPLWLSPFTSKRSLPDVRQAVAPVEAMTIPLWIRLMPLNRQKGMAEVTILINTRTTKGSPFLHAVGSFMSTPWRLEALTLGDLLVPTVSYTTQMGISVLASPTPAHRPTTGLLSAACEVR